MDYTDDEILGYPHLDPKEINDIPTTEAEQKIIEKGF